MVVFAGLFAFYIIWYIEVYLLLKAASGGLIKL
jgi:hypothetical protein